MENFLVFAQQQYLLIFSFAVFVFLLVRHEVARAGVKLSCQQVVQAMNAETAIALDVRETKEFADGHLVGAINIPFNKVADSLQMLEKYRQKQIVVIDKIGGHSGVVVKTLTADGFDAVRMAGGISEWQNDNLPLVK